MIDIILDKNINNEFCGKTYPFIEINDYISDDWNEYTKKAKQIIADNITNEAVTIKINNEKVSLNKLALALFIEAFENSGKLEYAVFKVKNLHEAQESYKPYIALTIGIKYALVLSKETPKNIYKHISELGYLGIETIQDYFTNTMVLKLANCSAPAQVFEAHNLQDVICKVGMLKALSLMKKEINIELIIKRNNISEDINKEDIAPSIIKETSVWMD